MIRTRTRSFVTRLVLCAGGVVLLAGTGGCGVDSKGEAGGGGGAFAPVEEHGEAHAGHGSTAGGGGHGEGHAGEAGHGGSGEEKGAGHGIVRVELSPKAVARSGIRVEPATSGGLAATLTVPAEVQLNPNRMAHVAPLVAGQLRDVKVLLGDRVREGQPLAVLRSVALGQARAELRRAAALLEVARANLARLERLRSEGIASQRAYLQARFEVAKARAERDAARARLTVLGGRGGHGPDMVLRAPIDGVVIERHATYGESVDPENTLFVIADLSSVWVIGRVYEQYMAAVKPGMTATLRLQAYPGRTWTGAVDYVANTLDESTRSLAVRVEVENPDGLLRAGLFGRLYLRRSDGEESGGGDGIAVVPEPAVQTLEGQAVVFVPDGEAAFRAVPVVTGLRGDGQVEVLEGVEPGTPVVVAGAFVLKSHAMRSELGEGHAH